MASVEIVAVGTELLLGQLVDTNTAFIAAQLAEAGIDVYATHAVGDNRERIAATLRGALERANGVVTSGGLGPTVDDLTKEAVCDALGIDTELHEPSIHAMEAFFASIGREMRENNRKQAFIPRGAHVLENPNGTAPGFIAFASGKFIASMPGVPREMRPMLTERLIPFLRKYFGLHEAIVTRVIHTINIAESEIDHRIGDLFATLENPKLAVLAHEGRCDVKIMLKSSGDAERTIEPVQREIEQRLAGHVFGYDSDTLESVIHALLQKHELYAAVAESCTGGRIAAALTAVPGSSKSFLGGIVAYDNAVKVAELDVPAELIEKHGAVSEEVVKAMAEGARWRLGANITLATTGITGPDGGTPEKPVGLVWFAISDLHGTSAQHVVFPGNRAAVQSRATTFALGFLWKHLSGTPIIKNNVPQ